MENRHEIHSVSRALTLTVLLNSAATIFSAVTLLRIPSDSKNAFLFGMSRARLLMSAAFLLLLGLNLLSFFLKEKLYRIFSQPAAHRFISVVVWGSLFILLMPAYRFGRFSAYYTRLQPFILWTFLTALCWDLCLRYCRDRFAALRDTCTNLRQHRRPIFRCGLGIVLLTLFIEITGLGKTPEDSLWNKNGIPLTSMQLYLAILAAVLFRKINKAKIPFRKKRTLHFFLIWLCAALIWNLAPLSPHFFAPGPYETTSSYYPYSDAATYDLAAQEALRGWGFSFHGSVLKPVVSLISFLTHAISGNDYNLAMRLQSALYGVLPAVIYLFGCEIGGVSCGFLAAGFSLLKEWNALNSHTVLTITSRLVMSEFLMQIIFASFCFAVFRWLKKDGHEILHAAAAGGFLCLGVFTRYNFLAFLPAALLLILISYRKNLRNCLKPCVSFLLVLCLSPLPFFQVNYSIVYEFTRTVKSVLIAQRFQTTENSTAAITPDTAAAYSNVEDSSEPVQILQINNIEVPDPTSVPPTEEVQKQVLTQPILTDTSEISGTSDSTEISEVEFNTEQSAQNKKNNISNKYLNILFSILNHGLHNWAGSVLTLPMQGSFDDLEHLFQNEDGRLWWDEWKGDYTPVQWAWLIGWLIAAAIALGCLLKQENLAGFSILYFWMVYCFSIGFSRSSGGRYLVPCNWIPMLLLAYGITLILNHGLLPQPQADSYPNRHSLLAFTGILGGFLSVFLLLAVFDRWIPSLRVSTQTDDLDLLQERLTALPGTENIDWEKVRTQQKNGEINVYHGITMYPRFYYYRIGEHNYVGATGWKDYSRMTFFGINDDGNGQVLLNEFILPQMTAVESFPQDSVFHLISCKTGNGYEDVLAVTLDTEDGETYTYLRDPLPDFSCPVAEPRCISIDQCE